MPNTWLHEPRDTFTTEQESLARADRCCVSKSDVPFMVHEAVPSLAGHPQAVIQCPLPALPQHLLDAAEAFYEFEQNKEMRKLVRES